MLRRFVRHSKTDPLVDEVQLMDVNPSYAYIRYSDGRESTILFNIICVITISIK